MVSVKDRIRAANAELKAAEVQHANRFDALENSVRAVQHLIQFPVDWGFALYLEDGRFTTDGFGPDSSHISIKAKGLIWQKRVIDRENEILEFIATYLEARCSELGIKLD